MVMCISGLRFIAFLISKFFNSILLKFYLVTENYLMVDV